MYHSYHFTITWDPILSILQMEAAHSSKKLASNFNTWCQNSEHYNLNNPHRQWGFRSSDMMLCWWVSGSQHIYGTVFLQNDRNHIPNNAVSYPSRHECSETMCDNVTTSNLIYMQIVWQYWPLMTELWVQFWVTSYMTFTVDELALENTSLQVLSIISHHLPFYRCSPLIYHSCWEVQQTCQGSISSCSLHPSQPVYSSSHGRDIMVHNFVFDKLLSTTF